MSRMCTEDHCPQETYARGLCRPHYASVMRVARLAEGVTSAGLQVSPERLEQERRYQAQLLLSAQRTHCKWGHAFTPANTRVHAKGYWICKICSRASKQKSQAKPVDMVSPVGPHNREKTHCARGHAFEEYSKPRRGGGRMCRLCTKQERRFRLYGLSPAQYDARIEAQGGRCAICQNPFTTDQQRHVDHDHHTLVVRGILCSRCNAALGLFCDNPQVMRAAALYVEQSRLASPGQPIGPEGATVP